MKREIIVAPDTVELVVLAAERIIDAAGRAIAANNQFSLALAGGHTPQGLYELLSSPAYRSRIDWPRVSIYFGDERCVAPDSDESNYHMAHTALLSKVPLVPENIHRMRGEIEPQIAAGEYGQLLKLKFGDGGLDLILLGMGADGHTASLFPGTAALHEKKHRCVANFVPHLQASRLTMTAPFINRAWAVMVLVAGKDKSARVHEVLEGPKDPERLPIQLIEPEIGTMTWMLDAGAAGMHEDEN